MMQVRFVGAIRHTANTPHPVRAGEGVYFGGKRSYRIDEVIWDMEKVGEPAQVAQVSIVEEAAS